MDRWRGRGLVSSGLTCLCSDPVLQCAAVQMMSSPPAAPNAMHVHCRGRMGVDTSGRGEGGDREGEQPNSSLTTR